MGVSGGNKPTIYFDITGKATLFNTIPLLTMKKANFINLVGAVYSLAKIVVNGVNYNISETAQNGAVVVSNNYMNWDFVAPDGKLKFEDYLNKNFGDALNTLHNAVHNSPIVPWNKFAAWVGENWGSISTTESNVYCYVRPIGISSSQAVPVKLVSFSDVTDFHSLLETVYVALENIHSYDMDKFKTNRGFGFVLRVSTEPISASTSYTTRGASTYSTREVWDCESDGHEFDESNDYCCSYCGTHKCEVEDHEFDENDDYYCRYCGTHRCDIEEHEFEDGECIYCYTSQCDLEGHDPDDWGVCINCGEYYWDCNEYGHYFENGSCYHCGEQEWDCSVDGHDYGSEGYCYECGEYWDCEVEGHYHDGSNECRYCGELLHNCEMDGHNYSWDGYCSYCGSYWDCAVEGHDYESSYECRYCGTLRCDITGYHEFVDGYCTACGYSYCTEYGHEYENGSCIYCGQDSGDSGDVGGGNNFIDLTIIFRE